MAEELGWAKTYGAEYVALARLEGCRLLTRDERLRRGAARVVECIGPMELWADPGAFGPYGPSCRPGGLRPGARN